MKCECDVHQSPMESSTLDGDTKIPMEEFVDANAVRELVERFEAILDREKKDNPDFDHVLKRYSIRPLRLTFQDIGVENKFQMFLSDENCAAKFVMFCFLAFIVYCLAHTRDLANQHTHFRQGAFWLPMTLRTVMMVYCVLVGLFLSIPLFGRGTCFPRLRNLVLSHQHRLFFALCFVNSIFADVSLFALNVNASSLPWSSQAFSVVGACILVRENWGVQTLATFIQVVAFALCAKGAGFPSDQVAEGTIGLLILGFISLWGFRAIEKDSRRMFCHQEISLYLANKHIAAQRDLAQQARVADETKVRFIANISHEIRTPLHGVITALELLKTSGDLNAEQQDYVQVAEHSGTLLLDILNNLLTMSKIQSGSVELDVKPINLRTIVESVAVAFSQVAAQKGVEVAVYIPASCPVHLLSDSVRLKQIIFNLVSNAVKFTPQGSVQISVSVNKETEEDVSLTISVKDTGIGVAPDQLHLLFRRFSQLDDSSTRRFQGTGLGLALVFEFAKMIGGNMSVHSEGLGTGTAFFLSAKFFKDPNRKSVSRLTTMPTLQNWTAVMFPEMHGMADYLKGFGMNTMIGDVNSDPVALRDRLKTVVPTAQENVLVAVIDHSLCSHPFVSQSLDLLEELCKEMHGPHFHLLILVLDDPCRPGHVQLPALESRHVWTLTKPCQLQKLESLIQSMQTHVHSSKDAQPVSFHRRFSAPSVAFGLKRMKDLLLRPRMSVVAETLHEPCPSIEPLPKALSIIEHSHRHHARRPPATVTFDDLTSFRFGGDPEPEAQTLPTIDIPTVCDSIPTHEDPQTPSSASGSPDACSPLDLLASRQSCTDESDICGVNLLSLPPPQLAAATPTTTFGQTSEAEGKEEANVETQPVVVDEKSKEEEKDVMASNRILVVDDNTINRRLTERVLVKAGFDCTSVEDGAQAVEAAIRQQFALIFMDITMPVMDGCTATRLIQEKQTERGVPKTVICALSAASDMFAHAKFDAILPKPVKSAELIETARRLSEQYRSQLHDNEC